MLSSSHFVHTRTLSPDCTWFDASQHRFTASSVRLQYYIANTSDYPVFLAKQCNPGVSEDSSLILKLLMIF